MKKFKWTFAWLAFSATAWANSPSVIPMAWLLNSENSESYSHSLVHSQFELLEKETTLILGSSLNAGTQTIPENHAQSASFSSWKMSGFTTEVAVSASGNIGVLSGNGKAAVSILWGKNSDHTLQRGLQFDLDTEPLDQERLILTAATANNQVKSPDLLKENLRKLMQDFSTLTRDLDLEAQRTQGQWRISKVKVNFGINAQGEIFLANPIKGDLGFSLQWHAGQKRSLGVEPSRSSSPRKFRWSEKLNTFISSLRNRLEDAVQEIESQKIMSSSLRASSLGIGFGISAQGEVGVVGTGGFVVGILTFERTKNTPVQRIQPQKLPLDLDQIALKNGLMKSVMIGDFFAKCAERVSGPNWGLRELNTNFELGLNGNTGLVQIGREISYQINFKKVTP